MSASASTAAAHPHTQHLASIAATWKEYHAMGEWLDRLSRVSENDPMIGKKSAKAMEEVINHMTEMVKAMSSFCYFKKDLNIMED